MPRDSQDVSAMTSLRGVHTRTGAVQFSWTEISFDTPGSSIVTP